MKNMNEKIENAMLLEIRARGYVAPVDVLLDIGFLDTKKYQDWRNGRVPYLEAVCNRNLHKLSEVLTVIRSPILKKRKSCSRKALCNALHRKEGQRK